MVNDDLPQHATPPMSPMASTPPMSPMASASPAEASAAPSLPRSAPTLPRATIIKGGLAVLVVGALLLLFVAGRGNATTTDELQVGDCFAVPSTDSGDSVFRDVTIQDCAGPHEAEIFAVVQGTLAAGHEQCATLLFDLPAIFDPSLATIPDEADLSVRTSLDDETRVLCALADEGGGLIGSVSQGS